MQFFYQLNRLPVIVFILFISSTIRGQELPPGNLKIKAGATVGSPVIIKNIPEGATGQPGAGINVGLEYAHLLTRELSLSIGAAYVKKGSRFSSPANGKYDAARGFLGERFPFPIRVKYEAEVEASYRMTYIDLPILLNWRLNLNKWSLGLGYQYSKMLNGSLEGELDIKALLMTFNDQPFDYSENIKDYDHAGIARLECLLTNRLGVAMEVTVSMQRLMMEMEEGLSNPRNVFANLLIGYRIF